ncbi:MAG: 2-dehydropantoate 2-reductase N-terminal domain-containing protein [Caulobacterales bacterium]
MTQESVLIVGAGAMGLINGYYLQQGGAKITFLVRPGKKAQSAPPAILYNYGSGELERFESYRVEDNLAALAGETFDYAIVTFDHAIAMSEDGTALLKALGKAFADKNTVIIMGGVGLGLREHFIQTTGLPESRILNGVLGLLSHQSSADLPLHAPTDAAKLKQSRMAYKHLNENSFMLDNMFPEVAQKFADLYTRSGKSGCAIIDKVQFAVMNNTAFPVLAAQEIAGWANIAELTAQKDLWALSCRAAREAAGLPELGMGDAIAEQAMSDETLAATYLGVEAASLPLDFAAFNRFHHGGKVAEQDLEIMKKCAAAGERGGRPMSALKEIIARLEALRAAA